MLVLPECKFNLLSVSRLTRELKCCVAFSPDFCIFQDLSNGMVKGIGREEHGLYILKSNSEKSAICGFTTRSVITQDKPSESTILWHKRLGHAPMNIIRVHKQLQHLHHSHQLCTVCPLAKHNKLHFPISSTYSKSVF